MMGKLKGREWKILRKRKEEGKYEKIQAFLRCWKVVRKL